MASSMGMQSKILRLACLFCGLMSLTTALVDNGKLASIDGINYWVGSTAVSRIPSAASLNWTWTESDIVPLTVVRTNATTFTSGDLEETIARFTSSDDVFTPGFLEGKTEIESPNHCSFDSSIKLILFQLSFSSTTVRVRATLIQPFNCMRQPIKTRWPSSLPDTTSSDPLSEPGYARVYRTDPTLYPQGLVTFSRPSDFTLIINWHLRRGQ